MLSKLYAEAKTRKYIPEIKLEDFIRNELRETCKMEFKYTYVSRNPLRFGILGEKN